MCHINLTASAFTDKGSYNSGKAPLHSQAVLLYGASECSVLLKDMFLYLDCPPPFHACFCCLTWISMHWAGVNFTPLVWNSLGSRHVHSRESDFAHSDLSLFVYSPVKYLTIPPSNPQPYPAKLHSILVLKWFYKNWGYLPVLADTIWPDYI